MIATDSQLQVAKEWLLIPALWHLLNLPGKPGRCCRSPFREDRNPSFSIYDGGRRWKDHATGEGGDVVDFLARALNLSNEDACKRLIELAGVSPKISHLPRREERQADGAKESVQLEFPPLTPYSWDLAQRVANSRGLKITAVEFAALWLKTLVFGCVCEQECWTLTDASRKCAAGRRIDGRPFPTIGTLAERKSHSLAGSRKSWPVGILPPGFEEPWLKQHVDKILLVEGGPDYLAACQFIAAQDMNVLPVAMLGASQTISDDALPYFADRKVTIVAHPDEAGRAAAMRWAKQIQGAKGAVRIFKLKESDLCEIVAGGAMHDELQLF
jgi:CHC2 zinc finger/Toprim-like